MQTNEIYAFQHNSQYFTKKKQFSLKGKESGSSSNHLYKNKINSSVGTCEILN